MIPAIEKKEKERSFEISGIVFTVKQKNGVDWEVTASSDGVEWTYIRGDDGRPERISRFNTRVQVLGRDSLSFQPEVYKKVRQVVEGIFKRREIQFKLDLST